MLELLEIERDAEVEETTALLTKYSFKELEKRNLAITKLFVKQVSTGVYGRVLVQLHRWNKSADKMRIFGPGDIVGLFEAGQAQKAPSAEGTVYRTTGEDITITFNEMQDFESFKQPLALVVLANEVTYQRCKMAIQQLQLHFEQLKNRSLVDVLFEETAPRMMH